MPALAGHAAGLALALEEHDPVGPGAASGGGRGETRRARADHDDVDRRLVRAHAAPGTGWERRQSVISASLPAQLKP